MTTREANQASNADMTTDCLPQGLGNCCVTWIAGRKRKSLSTADLRDLETLVRLEVGLKDNSQRTEDLGMWQLEHAHYKGEKPAAREELFKNWNMGIWSFHKDHSKDTKKASRRLDTAIFQSGNATVGEQKITIKRREKKR